MSFLESFDEGVEELVLSIFLPSSPSVLFFLSGSKVGSMLVEPFLDLASLNGENKGGGRGGGRRRERERERDIKIAEIITTDRHTYLGVPVWIVV